MHLRKELEVNAHSNGRIVTITFTLLGGRKIEHHLTPDEAQTLGARLMKTGAASILPLPLDPAVAREFGDRLQGLGTYIRG
ncbi:MAG TPA: hypothetical protein VGL89_14005 [Candidatus Koribacter sp.]